MTIAGLIFGCLLLLWFVLWRLILAPDGIKIWEATKIIVNVLVVIAVWSLVGWRDIDYD